jgi:hypothetical protein
MTADEARSVIRASIQRGSRTPRLGGKPREQYIQDETDALLGWVIDPLSVTVTGQSFGEELAASLASNPAIAIARARETWLLYIPETREFAQAHGWHAHDLTVLGFHSTDALAEWLG